MGATGGTTPDEIKIVEICKYMGRTYQALKETPYEVVIAILERMALEK